MGGVALKNVIFRDVVFARSSFQNQTIIRSVFFNCNFGRGDFRNAKFVSQVTPFNCSFKNADFTGANLDGLILNKDAKCDFTGAKVPLRYMAKFRAVVNGRAIEYATGYGSILWQ